MKNHLTAPLLLLAALVPVVGIAAAPPIQSHTCANGLEVLVVENHAMPLITIEFAARNGSMTENPQFNGLSHLYEHMFFKANGALPSQEAFMDRMRELGMSFNGTTGTERVNYFFTTTQDQLKDSMVFMRDAVVSPTFDPKELERERVVVTGEIDRNESNPYYHLFHQVDQRVWWKYPSYKDPLGTRKSVLAATPEMMRTIQKRYYVPNNSVLVVTGDVKAADIFAQVDALYATWKRGDDPFKKFPLVKHPAIAKSEVVLIEQPVQTVLLEYVWHGPSTVGASRAHSYAADLMGYAIQDPGSRFQRDLIDSGLCVRASLTWSTQVNTGPVMLVAEAMPDKADACASALLAELPKLKEPGFFSDAELTNAVHRLETDQTLEREKPSELAHVITFWWASAGLDYYNGYVDNVRKASRADIAKFLDTYVIAKPFVLGAMVSKEIIAEHKLDKQHFEQLVLAKPSPSVKKESQR